MKPSALNELPESLIEFNRIRYRNELAQGIFELMQTQRVSRSRLALFLGVERSRITHVLSGDKNLQANTLADILLVLGRTPHLTLGVDFDEIKFPVDEGAVQGSGRRTAKLDAHSRRSDRHGSQEKDYKVITDDTIRGSSQRWTKAGAKAWTEEDGRKYGQNAIVGRIAPDTSHASAGVV